MKQLSIKEVAFEAAWNYWGLRRELLSVMIIPIAAFLAIDTTASILDASGAVARWVYWACYLIVSALAAISCHRVMLLGPVSVPKFGIARLGERERNFISAALFLGLGAGLVNLFSTLALTSLVDLVDPEGADRYLSVQIIGSLCASYLFARLSLMLPSIAIETPLGIAQAWQLSNHNGWRLAALIVFLPWVVRLIEWIMAATLPDAVGRLANTAMFGLLLPLEIALLSVSYRHLIK